LEISGFSARSRFFPSLPKRKDSFPLEVWPSCTAVLLDATPALQQRHLEDQIPPFVRVSPERSGGKVFRNVRILRWDPRHGVLFPSGKSPSFQGELPLRGSEASAEKHRTGVSELCWRMQIEAHRRGVAGAGSFPPLNRIIFPKMRSVPFSLCFFFFVSCRAASRPCHRGRGFSQPSLEILLPPPRSMAGSLVPVGWTGLLEF